MQLSTKEAVESALAAGYTKYRLAKVIGVASSASVNQWLRGTKMRKDTAERFKAVTGIEINDYYDPDESAK